MSSCCTGTVIIGFERPIQTEGRKHLLIIYIDDNTHEYLIVLFYHHRFFAAISVSDLTPPPYENTL
jgi:hypothetical protein